MSQLLVDEETLESVTYERSKFWSNFLQCCAEEKDGEEIDLDTIDEIFKDDDEASFRHAEEADEDAEAEVNTAEGAAAAACKGKPDLTVMLSGDNKEILNQTLPIVEEHVRKWKAAGLDRILNTFDAQKIERHVGDWLRRHNSAYGEKTLLQSSPAKSSRKQHRSSHYHYSSEDSSGSEAESMHSVDTARYIRASRKRTVSSSVKCSSPMTTIKMYRTMPRMRDELRAKYGCDEYSEEQEHRHHMQMLRHRRNQLHQHSRERELVYHATPRHNPYRIGGSSHSHQRRKQLRKRRDHSPLYQSSASSDSESRYNHCDCSPCMRRALTRSAQPYCGYPSYQSRSIYRHQRLEVGSRSSHSVCSRSVRRQHVFDEDLRPRLMENECKCCNSERLCSKVLHIANRSTEEWVVENNSSPDPAQLSAPLQAPSARSKLLMQSVKSNQRRKTQPKHNCIEDTDDEEVTTTSEPNTLPVPKTEKKALVKFLNVNDSHTLSAHPGQGVCLPKSTPHKKVVNSTGDNKLMPMDVINLDSDDSEGEKSMQERTIVPFKSKSKLLSKASAMDKETTKPPSKPTVKSKHEENKGAPQKISTKTDGKKSIPKEPTTTNSTRKEPVTAKPATGIKAKTDHKAKRQIKRSKQLESSDESSEESDTELKKALMLSKESYLNEQKKLAEAKVADDFSSPQLPEQSTFNVHSVACNSTAISNKDSSSTSAGKRPASRSASAVFKKPEGFKTPEGDSVVTSTTICEPPGATSKTPTPSPQQDQIKITDKGILLHSATDRANSSSSSYFNLTEENLGRIIGQRKASKFLKYHVGNRSFDSRLSIYFRPTAKILSQLTEQAKSLDYSSPSSSDSDGDIFDHCNRYGKIYIEISNFLQRKRN